MKSFICQIFYKQRAAFEQSCASRGKEYPLPEDVFLQSDIFYDEKHVPAHRLDVYRPRGTERRDSSGHRQRTWRRPPHGEQGVQPSLLCLPL